MAVNLGLVSLVGMGAFLSGCTTVPDIHLVMKEMDDQETTKLILEEFERTLNNRPREEECPNGEEKQDKFYKEYPEPSSLSDNYPSARLNTIPQGARGPSTLMAIHNPSIDLRGINYMMNRSPSSTRSQKVVQKTLETLDEPEKEFGDGEAKRIAFSLLAGPDLGSVVDWGYSQVDGIRKIKQSVLENPIEEYTGVKFSFSTNNSSSDGPKISLRAKKKLKTLGIPGELAFEISRDTMSSAGCNNAWLESSPNPYESSFISETPSFFLLENPKSLVTTFSYVIRF